MENSTERNCHSCGRCAHEKCENCGDCVYCGTPMRDALLESPPVSSTWSWGGNLAPSMWAPGTFDSTYGKINSFDPVEELKKEKE